MKRRPIVGDADGTLQKLRGDLSRLLPEQRFKKQPTPSEVSADEASRLEAEQIAPADTLKQGMGTGSGHRQPVCIRPAIAGPDSTPRPAGIQRS